MQTDVPIRCGCGALGGTARALSAETGNRLICHCDDCQTFPFALGCADRVLDAHGGTDIFQTSPAKVSFDSGREHLACLRLTPGGLLRWFADCCQTPIGNTIARAGMPFVGLVHVALDVESLGRGRDDVLGPVRDRIQGRFARGGASAAGARDRVSPATVVRITSMILRARLRGDQRRSPFFDAQGATTVEPRVLEPEALHAAETARDAAPAPGA